MRKAPKDQPDLFTARSDEQRIQFSVDLNVFSGPFEVLLSLIAKKKLDVTEVALAQVTDEFLTFVASQSEIDLSQASQFLLVAATLLDAKAARLLPREEHDDDDLEILEARDLLFAKLLQYKAYKDVAADLAIRLSAQSLSVARDVDLEEGFRKAMPEVSIDLNLGDFARLAAHAFARHEPTVMLDHLHDPIVSVDSQIEFIRERLLIGDAVTFHSLCADARTVPTVVSRFLALLELIRGGEVTVSQDAPLAPLTIIRVTSAIDAGIGSLGS
ncbi:MAG: ScpA family protein [Actinomycetaceae bacterium]|nr:segregation/condensation protein A [Arcanobacterium sp.]MDD7505763.1 ScpA family protein [Actinomycetaceae bacterium]MDY6143638.1 ScpA family protein [Arcanobacterium sp.]